MSYTFDQPQQPIEDVNRGTLVALLAVPAGIIVWTLIWSIGFIASIVTFGIALAATFLYRLGSGGTIGRAGAIRITIITLATVVLAIIAGLVADVAIGISQVADISPIDALTYPGFGDVFSLYLSQGGASLYGSLAIAVVFGLLGCFSTLRGAFAATAAPAAPAAQQPWGTLPTQQGFASPAAEQQQPWQQTPPAQQWPAPPAEQQQQPWQQTPPAQQQWPTPPTDQQPWQTPPATPPGDQQWPAPTTDPKP